MSNKITNTQRTEFLNRVLRETFAPRFADIQKKLDVLAKAAVEAQHPAFAKALKDKNVRPYLAVNGETEVFITDGKKGRPHYPVRWGAVNCAKKDDSYSCVSYDGMRNFHGNASNPRHHYTVFNLSDHPELHAEYNAAWADYAVAQETLKATIYAYTNRAKFEVDFPDLAKYLPQPEKPVGTAVAVQVGDVMQKLAHVGIPPSK